MYDSVSSYNIPRYFEDLINSHTVIARIYFLVHFPVKFQIVLEVSVIKNIS